MRELMIIVIQRALEGAESLPATQRADLFEGISVLCDTHLPDVSKAASETAETLRAAEQRQLTFASMLRQ